MSNVDIKVLLDDALKDRKPQKEYPRQVVFFDPELEEKWEREKKKPGYAEEQRGICLTIGVNGVLEEVPFSKYCSITDEELVPHIKRVFDFDDETCASFQKHGIAPFHLYKAVREELDKFIRRRGGVGGSTEREKN
jgi:hypothetical protein